MKTIPEIKLSREKNLTDQESAMTGNSRELTNTEECRIANLKFITLTKDTNSKYTIIIEVNTMIVVYLQAYHGNSS